MKFVLALAAVVVVALAQRPTPWPVPDLRLPDCPGRPPLPQQHQRQGSPSNPAHPGVQRARPLRGLKDAVTQCKAMVAAQIDTIYADLTAGKDPWQTCFDLHECFGTEPTHGTRPSQGPEAVARGARYF
ncbi:unnamed protein product, partial [Mesorhabditis spiculigera]